MAGLSAKDKAAVKKAGEAGGLKNVKVSSSGNVSSSNSATKTGVNPQSGEPVNSAPAPVVPTPPAIQPPVEQPAIAPSTDTTTGTPTPTTEAAQTTQQAGSGINMPATGSVVDLLNQQGQDSSYAARAQLAQQYGIQNYAGTAAQNTELAQKYMSAHGQLSGSAVPQNSAEASQALQTYQDGAVTTPQGNPTQQFYDAYGSMDPVMKSIYDQINQINSYINDKTSIQEEISKLPEFKERNDVKAELLDTKRIIEGTEDDIRDEIEHSGGFATNSQILALSSARNKVLLKKANALTDQFNVLNDYVNQITDLTKADRAEVMQDMQTKLGLATTVFQMTQTMKSNAQQNYKMLLDSVGWGGIAQMTAGNPAQARAIENSFGLAPGSIQSLAAYKPPVSEMEMLQLENQKLQNAKLQRDLAKVPASAMTPATKAMAISMQQSTISDTSNLLNAPGLNSAVGPNFLSRIAVADAFGAKSNFIAGVEQLRQNLTLEQLISAKGSGATFGALSDAELQLISASASKLGTWAIKDKGGNVTGYSVDEASFKKELDKINNFQKTDYILKGGDPSSVGVQQMSDGSLWAKNSDGTLTRL